MSVVGFERSETFVPFGHQQILCVADHPAGKPIAAIVFCHGMTGDRIGPQKLQTILAEELAMDGILSIRFDFRGSGDSSGSFGQTSFRTMQEDLRAVVHWTRQQYKTDHVGLLGVSIGGVIPSLMAEELRACCVVLLSSDLVEDVRFATDTTTPVRKGEFYLEPEFFREREELRPLTALASSSVRSRLYYGDEDDKLTLAARRFEAAGIEVERVKRCGHLFEDLDIRRYLGRRVAEFVRESALAGPEARMVAK